ncbi:hypothetical protein Bresa_03676|uniref:Uncharacterized protein n=1 Tax=Brenneria salicis ATCC 15712 = DSM 30166 TaxID=714314 RepID=A0A366HZJ3_9GAMM|nr:hypothetical protein [Brenneria salicis ATCC 15712 = DSM 30166]RBP57925.1 hypothetical protein DES54_15615 [Brenneria salicis ATCC 15712 = DSM 30166]
MPQCCFMLIPTGFHLNPKPYFMAAERLQNRVYRRDKPQDGAAFACFHPVEKESTALLTMHNKSATCSATKQKVRRLFPHLARTLLSQ